MSADEICRIIKQCQDSGIVQFAFQDLTLSFLPRRNEDASKPGQASDSVGVDALSKTDEKNMDVMNEQTMDDAEEAQLLIDDPSGFERYQIDKHIETGRRLDEKSQPRTTEPAI